MTVQECPRESDVIDAIIAADGRTSATKHCTRTSHSATSAVRLSRWRVCCVSTATTCTRSSPLPGAGQVWWRAAIRARLEASQQVTRPLSWVFGISVACVVGLALAVVELLWSPLQSVVQSTATSGWTNRFGLGEMTRWLPSFSDLTPLTTTAVFVVLGAAACLVLAPLALYFALSDE